MEILTFANTCKRNETSKGKCGDNHFRYLSLIRAVSKYTGFERILEVLSNTEFQELNTYFGF